MQNNYSGSYMTLEENFTGICTRDYQMLPSSWDLEIDLIDTGEEHPLEDVTKSYFKIKHFIDLYLNEAIFVNAYDEDMYDSVEDCLISNNTIACPGEPSDDLIIKLLYCKFSVLVGNVLNIGQIRLKSSHSKVTFHYYPDCYELPEQKDFIGEESLFSKPWWVRDDCDTSEYLFDEGGESREEQIAAISSATLLDELIDGFIADYSDDEDSPKVAEIIPIKRWKPEIVDK